MTNQSGSGRNTAHVRRIHIKNFRAIANATIDFEDTVALVGQNGGGKTSILRALNAFFNFESERQAFEEGNHQYSSKSQTVIEVALTGLPAAKFPLSGKSNEFRARLKYRKQAVWEVQRNGQWEKDTSFREMLDRFFSYVLIPIRRDHEVAHSPSDGLLDLAVEEWVTAASQRDVRSPQIQKVADQLRDKTLSGLEQHLRQIAPMDGPFSFEFSYSVPPDYRLLLQNLALSVREGGQLIPLADSGSGTQSMAVFALYAYLAQLQDRSYLLGVEEPEQNLHPQAQQQLMRNLRKTGLQVIFTTHSPTIVDMLEHECVVLCRRGEGQRRELEISVSQIGSTFFESRGLDRDAYYKFHRRNNSEFLFADLVVATESPIDSAVVEQLLSDAGEDIRELGISLVSLNGKENLRYLFHLLDALAIPYAFVVDRDYFLKFKGDTRKDSLNKEGYPQYLAELQPSCVLPRLGLRESHLNRLTTDLAVHPTKAFRELTDLGFFCFMWDIEIDLVRSSNARERFYGRLNIPTEDRNAEFLLKKRSSAIKKQEALIPVVEGLPPQSLPSSYKALRRELPLRARAAKRK